MKKILFFSLAALAVSSMGAAIKAPQVIQRTPAAAVTRSEDDGIIEKTPEGRVVKYARDADYFYVGNGSMVFFGKDNAFVAEVVFADNEEGDVYIKNPISGFTTGTYIKGQLKDGVITCQFPQTIATGEVNGKKVEYKVNRMTYTDLYDQYGDWLGSDYLIDSDNNYMTWEYNEKTGMITQEMEQSAIAGELPQVIMGVSYNDPKEGEVWAPYGDCNQFYYEFHDHTIQLPEGAEPTKWICHFWQEETHWNTDDKLMNVYIDGNDFYLGDLYRNAQRDNYIKGTIKGDRVEFPSGQYIGINEATNHYAYIVGATARFEKLPGTNYLTPFLDYAETLVFDYDADSEIMMSDMIMAVNNGFNGTDVNEIALYVEPTIQWANVADPAAPAKPNWSLVEFNDYDKDDGHLTFAGSMLFFLPKNDINGNPLNTENMYYRIWTDDIPLVLTPDEYPGVEEDMEYIPYEFDNNYNILVNGTYHQVLFYFKDQPELFKIRSYYMLEDGTMLESEADITTDVDEVIESAVVATETFDLLGNRVGNDAKGVVIELRKMADGSVKAVKSLKR